MNFSWSRLSSVFKKEFMHIIRDPFTLLFSMTLPFLIIIILGNSIEFNLNEISTVIVDQDKTEESRKLIETFGSSNYFKMYYSSESPEEAYNNVLEEKAKVEIVIPPRFGEHIRSGDSADVQLLLDGADNSSVSAIMNYIGTINTEAVKKITKNSINSPLNIKERYLFNPELSSKWFAIPGLAAVIIAIVAILLTALTICREWEQGSMELLISTPVQSTELILGKITPYAILSSIGFIIVYLCARLFFKIPMVGSHTVLFLSTLLFILNYLGIGLLISVTTKVQQIAVQKAMIIGLLPTSLLSGFIFPVSYMPDILRYLTAIFPPRWYVDIARNEFLQGSSFKDLIVPFSVLFVQSFAVITTAIKKFKRSLD